MANKKVSQLTSKPSVLVTDLFPIADPSTGQLYKTTISDLGTAIGSGVSSVNGLVGAVVLDTDDIQELVSPTNKWFTDTRARAALSASSPLAYNSGTGVFSIPAATSSQNGYLTSTDWTTFNGKQAALSGTGFVKISGTTISYDNSTYALDSAVVHNTGTESVGGIKTFTSQAVFNNSFIIKNTNSGSVSYGGNTTIWTSDDSFNILVGTASSTTKSFSFIYGSNVQLTLPSSDGTLALTSQLSSYLPLTGGTLTGALTISTSSGQPLTLNSTDTSLNQIIFNRSGTTLGKVYLYYDTVNSRPEMVIGSYGTGGRVRIESGNNTTALTLDASQNAQFVGTISATGATLTGALSGTSATFSSSVTATSFISDGTTSEGIIKIERDTVSTNTVIGSLIFTNNNGATTYGKVFGGRNSAGDGYVALGTGVSNNLYALESGYVGIGTTTPSTKLDVLGEARIQGGGAVSYAVFNLLDNSSGGSNWAILNGFSALGDFTIRESGVANHLVIKKTSGAATFSSSVATSAIKFPSTQNADSDPNTLDDYEEGTFTPTLTGSGSNPTVSYTSSTGGIYTKVGNKVSISFEVRWTSLSGGSGFAYVSGLPFTRRGPVSPDADHLIIDSYNNIISGLYLIGNVGGTTTNIALNIVRSNNTTLGLNLSDLASSGIAFLRGSVTYFV